MEMEAVCQSEIFDLST